MIVRVTTHPAITHVRKDGQIQHIAHGRTGIAFERADGTTVVWWQIRPGRLYREVPGEEGVQIR